MKKFKKQKGFTLIEILAAIVILGILSTIAVVSVNKIIQLGKEKHYKTAEKNLILAGESYVQENRSELPKAIGQKKIVYLKTLQEKKYIKSIYDYNENECDADSSYVQIYKYSNNDYSYLPYLKCPSYKSNIKKQSYKPYVSIEFSGKEEKNAEVTITMEDSNKLMSYNYIIYRGTKEVKNSGSIAVADYSKKVIKKVALSGYTPGKLKVVVVATNIYGNTYTAAKEYNFEDKVNPICEYIDEKDHPDNPKPWTNTGTRKITVRCKDGEGSGCTRETFTKTFKDTTKIGTIKLSDEAGNTYDCEVSVYIDKTKPTITVNVYKLNKSGNKTGSVIATETVNHSKSTQTLDLSKLSSTKWLNKKDYEYGLYYEVEFSDGLALNTYTIKENNASLQESTIDAATNIIINETSTGKTATTSFKTTEDGYRTYVLTATDDAGNISTLNIITPIDRVAPNVPTLNMYNWISNDIVPTGTTGLTEYPNNTWTNLNVYTTATSSSDDISGFKEYQYTTTGKTTNEEDEAASTRSIKTEGTSYIKYRACDNAGNCSSYTSNKTIKLDKTKPTCTVTGGSTNWINNASTIKSRVISATCSDDNGSGCVTDDFSYTYSSNINTKTAGAEGDGLGGVVADEAGNITYCEAGETVKIDKDIPEITEIYNPTSGNPTDESFSLTLYGVDTGGSDIAYWSYKYAGGKWNKYASSNYSPFETPQFSTARNEDVYIKLCDNAGNCSSSSTSPIYIVEDMCDSPEIDTCGAWSWSTCTKDCGGGTKYQYRTCTLKSSYDHSTSCPGTKTEKQNEGTSCNTQSCDEQINDTRYYDCDSYYITTCNTTTCNYTKKNGVSANGTIPLNSLTTSRGDCDKTYCNPYINSKSGSTVKFVVTPKVEQCKVKSYSTGSCSKEGSGDYYIKAGYSSIGKGSYCRITIYFYGISYVWNGNEYSSSSWKTYNCGDSRYCTQDCDRTSPCVN